MSEKNIEVSPYRRADRIIDLSGSVTVDSIEESIPVNPSGYLNLHNHPLRNTDALIPRNHLWLKISLTPSWRNGYSQNDFIHVINSQEITEEILKLRIQCTCKNTRWCSDQVVMALSEINGKNRVQLNIPIEDV